MPHSLVFEQYDSIQANQVNWLPERGRNLKSLKQLRETITYRMDRMGSWREQDTIEEFKNLNVDQIEFQKSILRSLCRLVDGGIWNLSFDPTERTSPLKTRFSEYENLANYIN
jgi:hypothetical protein